MKRVAILGSGVMVGIAAGLNATVPVPNKARYVLVARPEVTTIPAAAGTLGLKRYEGVVWTGVGMRILGSVVETVAEMEDR